MKRYVICIIVILLMVMGGLILKITAQDNDNPETQWPLFAEWYQWKLQTDLLPSQREVVEYLEQATALFNKASETRNVHPESKYGLPDPQGAINIVEDSMIAIQQLPCPMDCEQYRDISVRIMEGIISYHQIRAEYQEGTKEFQDAHQQHLLNEASTGLGGKRFNGYFAAMRSVGLFDSIEEEMKALEEKGDVSLRDR